MTRQAPTALEAKPARVYTKRERPPMPLITEFDIPKRWADHDRGQRHQDLLYEGFSDRDSVNQPIIEDGVYID